MGAAGSDTRRPATDAIDCSGVRTMVLPRAVTVIARASVSSRTLTWKLDARSSSAIISTSFTNDGRQRPRCRRSSTAATARPAGSAPRDGIRSRAGRSRREWPEPGGGSQPFHHLRSPANGQITGAVTSPCDRSTSTRLVPGSRQSVPGDGRHRRRRAPSRDARRAGSALRPRGRET